jgi:anti-sigma B factor antagonist
MQQSALSPDFSCAVEPHRERVIVRVAGEVDISVAPRVGATVDELLKVGFARIVVDLREVTFLDSSGIHMLVTAHRSAARSGCRLSLIRGPQHVHRVFELTATASLFVIDAAAPER